MLRPWLRLATEDRIACICPDPPYVAVLSGKGLLRAGACRAGGYAGLSVLLLLHSSLPQRLPEPRTIFSGGGSVADGVGPCPELPGQTWTVWCEQRAVRCERVMRGPLVPVVSTGRARGYGAKVRVLVPLRRADGASASCRLWEKLVTFQS